MAKLHYIREIMQLKGLSINDLAGKMGVTQQTVSHYMVGDLRVSTARKVADALEVPLYAIFVQPEYIKDKTASEENVPATVLCPKCGAELAVSVTQK